jgi:flagellar basal-body rod protein FlgB
MAIIDAVEHLRGALDYHLARHNLLASNLAHIDTPGYKPVDLARTGSGGEGGSFQGALHVAIEATQPGHMAPSAHAAGPTGASVGRVVDDPGAAAGNDGNGVDLDREAVKISSNQVRYDMLAQLASSELASLEWAATDGKR